MKRHNDALVGIIIMVVSLTSGCADGATGPELRAETIFDYDITAGQVIISNRPSGSFRIEGPARLDWDYVEGQGILRLSTSTGTLHVLPLEVFESEPLTPEEIANIRPFFNQVPRIIELLDGATDAPDEQWVEAYMQWTEEKGELETQAQIRYAGDTRLDRDTVALEIVSDLEANPIVDYARLVVPEPGDQARTLWIRYEGVADHHDGSPFEYSCELKPEYHEPPQHRDWVSFREAQARFREIYIIFSVGKPVVVDVSTGLIHTNIGRR